MTRMKRILCMLLAWCMAFGLFPNFAFAANDVANFIDVNKSDWFYDDVTYVCERGLMDGTSDTTFSPKEATPRAKIVTILHRLEGTPSASDAGFSDVAEGQYFTEAVNWAAEHNIVNGYGDGKFGPNDDVTREQMATILYRYAAYKNYDVTERADCSKFSDAAQIRSYATDSLAWCVAQGLIVGMDDGTFVPHGNITNAQVATIVARFCTNIVPSEQQPTGSSSNATIKEPEKSNPNKSDVGIETAELNSLKIILISKLKNKLGNVNIIDFCAADFDGNGSIEAFAVIGDVVNAHENRDEVYPATVYFVTEDKIETVLKDVALITYGEPNHLLNFGSKSFFTVGKYIATGAPTYVFGVSNGQWVEDKLSLSGVDLVQIPGTNDLMIFHSTYDATYDGKIYIGHTWKPYYLYWDNGFKEYGGIKIAENVLLQCNGAQEILNSIRKIGGTINSILYRNNKIININYSTLESSGFINYHNATLRLEGNTVSIVTNSSYSDNLLDNSDYGGTYNPALIPGIATYPESFAA